MNATAEKIMKIDEYRERLRQTMKIRTNSGRELTGISKQIYIGVTGNAHAQIATNETKDGWDCGAIIEIH